MKTNKIKWLSPAPLWPELRKNGDFDIPQILQFETDSFMQDLMNTLQTEATDMTKYLAKKENWRGEELTTLKLYQPAHQRHYLVSASLCCFLPGLPDRTVNAGLKESVSFVVRRLLPTDEHSMPNADEEHAGLEEYALLEKADGYRWVRVVNSQQLSPKVIVPAEQILPLFALNYPENAERSRRLFAGTIPVGKREVYVNSMIAASDGDTSLDNGGDAILRQKILFLTTVIAPWENLVDSAISYYSLMNPDRFQGDDPPQNLDSEIRIIRDQIQTGSWYILFDFAKFLQEHLNDVWQVIKRNDGGASGLVGKANELFNKLKHAINLSDFAGSPSPSLLDALRNIEKEDLENVQKPFDRTLTSGDGPQDDRWPDWYFPLVDLPSPVSPPLREWTFENVNTLQMADGASFTIDDLITLVDAALNEIPEEKRKAAPPIPLAAQIFQADKKRPASGDAEPTFLIRCVYERPQCRELTFSVSKPTEIFQLAGFFDVDAPARPIRISLPVDPTPAGLRKYAKNTAFMMSGKLCGQMSAIKKVTFGNLVRSVLPWPFHKDLPIKAGNIKPCQDGSGNPRGRICSLSIPIVTICAMFLLIMIVLILDYVFRWVPWLISCFSISERK